MAEKRENRREEIISIAAQLFYEKGYAKATVRDLAKKVGIQSGSIFHHFQSKEEILFAVMEEVMLDLNKQMKEALDQANSPLNRLRGVIRTDLLAILGDRRTSMRVLLYEWRNLSFEKQRKILKLRHIYENMWMSALNEGKELKLVTGNTTTLRKLLAGSINWTVNWFRIDGSMSLEDLVEQILYMILKPFQQDYI